MKSGLFSEQFPPNTRKLTWWPMFRKLTSSAVDDSFLPKGAPSAERDIRKVPGGCLNHVSRWWSKCSSSTRYIYATFKRISTKSRLQPLIMAISSVLPISKEFMKDVTSLYFKMGGTLPVWIWHFFWNCRSAFLRDWYFLLLSNPPAYRNFTLLMMFSCELVSLDGLTWSPIAFWAFLDFEM